MHSLLSQVSPACVSGPMEYFLLLLALCRTSGVRRYQQHACTYTSLKTWDITDRLAEINVPTLLVSGQYDEATPYMVGEIHKRIPGAQWHLFPESSHMPHIEEPALFKRVVCDFLDAATA